MEGDVVRRVCWAGGCDDVGGDVIGEGLLISVLLISRIHCQHLLHLNCLVSASVLEYC